MICEAIAGMWIALNISGDFQEKCNSNNIELKIS